MQQWQAYSEKYSQLTQREQILILLTGLVLLFILIFNFWVENNLAKIDGNYKNITQLTVRNQSMIDSITVLEEALKQDPNLAVKQKISQYQHKLEKVDGDLLALTSALINPLQMRFALIDLLKEKKGVSLVSFELIGPKPLLMPSEMMLDDGVNQQGNAKSGVHLAENSKEQAQVMVSSDDNQQALGLYRHGIKIKLKGNYFALRDYLVQLEGLSWQFFWQSFQYKLLEHPNSELEIEIYSLSTKRVFIGV
jgi:MSHA biogenesis protein MshJ